MSIEDELEVVDEEEVKIEEPKNIWERILKAESPQKDVSEYINHPLNLDKKESTARIIRGVEGILGNLDKAVVDILVGIVQKVGELFGRRREGEAI